MIYWIDAEGGWGSGFRLKIRLREGCELYVCKPYNTVATHAFRLDQPHVVVFGANQVILVDDMVFSYMFENI